MAENPICTICRDEVSIERSSARLTCGHFFHLDCIGSAFNVSGVMQCPNCRKTENGEWRYANDSLNFDSDQEDELNADDHLVQLEPSGFPPHVFPEVQFQIRGLPATGYHEIVQRTTVFYTQNDLRAPVHHSTCPFSPITYGQRSGIGPPPVPVPVPASAPFLSPVPAPPPPSPPAQSIVRFRVGNQESVENLPSLPVLASLSRRSSNTGQHGPLSLDDIGEDDYPVLSLGIPGAEHRESERVVASEQLGPDGLFFRVF